MSKSAIESPSYQAPIEEIKNIISEEIILLTEQLKNNIDNDVRNIFSIIDLNNNIGALYNGYNNIIYNIFYKYLFLNANIKTESNDNTKIKIDGKIFSISGESQVIIKDFVIDYFQKTLVIFKKRLNEIIKKIFR